MTVITVVDSCLEKSKFHRFAYAIFGLFILFLAVKNFLAH